MREVNRETAILIALVLIILVMVAAVLIMTGVVDFGERGVQFIKESAGPEDTPDVEGLNEWL